MTEILNALYMVKRIQEGEEPDEEVTEIEAVKAQFKDGKKETYTTKFANKSEREDFYKLKKNLNMSPPRVS
jgi:hypothetical protein